MCVRMSVSNEISSRCWEAEFWFGDSLNGGNKKCQNGVRHVDLDLENEVKVWRSRNFSWLYLGQLSNTESECLVFRDRILNRFKACEQEN